jgi:hypothetical protein
MRAKRGLRDVCAQRPLKPSTLPDDGTVHQQTSNVRGHAPQTSPHLHTRQPLHTRKHIHTGTRTCRYPPHSKLTDAVRCVYFRLSFSCKSWSFIARQRTICCAPWRRLWWPWARVHRLAQGPSSSRPADLLNTSVRSPPRYTHTHTHTHTSCIRRRYLCLRASPCPYAPRLHLHMSNFYLFLCPSLSLSLLSSDGAGVPKQQS